MSNINEFKKMKGLIEAYSSMTEGYKKKKMKEEMCDKCGEEPCVCEAYEEIEIPEGVAKEDASDFVVAASAAKKEGKKKFTFGGKEYPVTIKTDVKVEEFTPCKDCDTQAECMKESKCMKTESDDKSNDNVEVNPEEPEGN